MRLNKILLSTLVLPLALTLHCQGPARAPGTEPAAGDKMATEQPAPDRSMPESPDMGASDVTMPDLSMPSCSNSNLVCGGECIDPQQDSAHCGGCDQACGAEQICVAATCVGSGTLQISALWSRSGDGDLIVTTPNGKTISFSNRDPGDGTDGGQMDRDDVAGTGPENIFWDSATTPPSGAYHVCFMTSSFAPAPSSTDPVEVTIITRAPEQTSQTVRKTFAASAVGVTECSPGDPTFIMTLTVP
jgi:hypothetical protein